MTSPGRWREFPLIADIRRLAGPVRPPDCLGIGDDAAVYRPAASGRWEAVTCDTLVEGVHWSGDWCGPEAAGRRIAAVNLSDLAAMGATPERAYLSLALPRNFSAANAHRLAAGVVRELRRHGARLLGGDTVATPGPLTATLTLQGSLPRSEWLTRRGARPGDLLLVTGNLGAPAAALAWLRSRRRVSPAFAPLVRRLVRPVPLLAAGRVLAHTRRVHAALDLSDGLAGDARRLAEASRVGLTVHAERLPVSTLVRRAAQALQRDPLDWALSGGEDFELLFAARAADAQHIARQLRALARVSCAVIGEVTPARSGLKLLRHGRLRPWPRGWEHNR
ncbi:MAG: thiamine-phosphate kinase [candidate division FCPU426 bacterium]